jgi:hypothetical protein
MKYKQLRSTRGGYIMIFTLLVIAISMVIVAYIGQRGSIHGPFMRTAIDREKAKILALSGVQVAIAQLSQKTDQKEKKAEPQQKEEAGKSSATQSNDAKNLLQTLLLVINRWQDFDLVESVDGVDGRISLCLMCEEGKINLNRVYNFKKEMFRGDKEKGWKTIMPELFKSIEKITKDSDGSLFTAFEKMCKERRSKFNDATEMITKKEFNYFKQLLFYEPLIVVSAEKKDKKPQTIYLTDIFTVWSSSGKIEPWLFSHSLQTIFGFDSAAQEGDAKKRKEMVDGWLKNFKQKANWQQDWKTMLQPMYGKELRTLPKNIDSMLSATCDPHFFSVRVHGKVGEVTQRLYAILERTKRSGSADSVYDIAVKKLYWL